MLRIIVPGLLAAALAGCGTPAQPPADQPVAIIHAAAVLQPARAETPLIDVRGPTERGRDGISATPHRWITYGQDSGRAPVTDADRQSFLRQVREAVGPPPGDVLVFCSTGVRSARAAVTLVHAGYAATSVCDGWLGNHTGPGLRAAETPPAAR